MIDVPRALSARRRRFTEYCSSGAVEGNFLVGDFVSRLWVNSLIPVDAFIRFKEGPLANSGLHYLTLSAGPYSVWVMELRGNHPGPYYPSNYQIGSLKEFTLTDLEAVEVSCTEALLGTGPVLSWQQKGEWMSLPTFIE